MIREILHFLNSERGQVTPVPVPTATPSRPQPQGTPEPTAQRRPVSIRVPTAVARPGGMVSIEGRNYLILELVPGAVTAAPGQGGIQTVTAIEVLPTDSPAGIRALLGAAEEPPVTGGGETGGGGLTWVDRLLGRTGASAEPTGTTATTATPTNIAELTERCLTGDLEACATLTVIRQALPEQFDEGSLGPGGLTFEQELELERLRQQPDFASLQAGARGEAQRVTEAISTGLAQALAAIGFAAPELFLSQSTDPEGLRDALARALEGGQGVFPTLERQQLVAGAAQNPTDVIRLLFLAGGQTPPPRRTGAFNVQSTLEQGRRAREDLARQITGLDLPSFDELVQRFSPPIPGAAKGAIVEMRRTQSGVYEAASGAAVVEGPEIFTVGEAGEEFALLPPGAIIAPKLDGEPSTRSAAVRAVAEMLIFGRRLDGEKPKAAKSSKAKGAQTGALISEADQPMQALSSVLEALGGAGAALQGSGRSTSERTRDTRLQIFPFPTTTPEQRGTILAASRNNPFLRDILNIGLTERARNPVPFAQQSLIERQNTARSQVRQAMARYFNALGLKFEDLAPEEQERLVNKQLLVHAPDLFGSVGGIQQEITGQTLQGIDESIREGGGAPGTQLPFAKLEALPAGARAATLTALGALFGSDVITDLLDLFREGRQQAFAAGESRLLI